MSRDQLPDIFYKNEDPIPLTNGELTKKHDEEIESYLVLRIENHSDKIVWGTLDLFPYGYFRGISFVFDKLKPHMASPETYVIFLGGGYITEREGDQPDAKELPPPIKIKWKKLYVE